MAVIAITRQPDQNALMAAYNEVIISAKVDDVPPVVFCDVYFNGMYYKSFFKTQPFSTDAPTSTSVFEFDLQDAAQEYLKYQVGPVDDAGIEATVPCMIKCMCRVRSSTLNADGFTVPDGIPPVQGTGSTFPIGSSSGTATNDFYILNCALQHDDNQVLADHLNSFKKGIWVNTMLSKAFPLTHRPDRYKVDLNSSDYFPIVYVGDNDIDGVRLKYRLKGSSLFSSETNGGIGNGNILKVVNLQVDIDEDDHVELTWLVPGPGVPVGVDIQYRYDEGDPWSDGNFMHSDPFGVAVDDGDALNQAVPIFFRVAPTANNDQVGYYSSVKYTP
jgi:hypothetical protein